MRKIIEAVFEELKDKNATMDMMRSHLRVAIRLAPFEVTDKEFDYMFTELIHRLPFNPTEEVNQFYD